MLFMIIAIDLIVDEMLKLLGLWIITTIWDDGIIWLYWVEYGMLMLYEPIHVFYVSSFMLKMHEVFMYAMAQYVEVLTSDNIDIIC